MEEKVRVKNLTSESSQAYVPEHLLDWLCNLQEVWSISGLPMP